MKCRNAGNKAERPSERPPLPAKHNLSDGLSIETGLMVIQIQIGLIFDAVSLVLNRDIQFLIAAFEFQIGIVVFDFRFDNLEAVSADGVKAAVVAVRRKKWLPSAF